MLILQKVMTVLGAVGAVSLLSTIAYSAQAPTKVELLRDASFQRGFILLDPVPGRKNAIDVVDLGVKSNEPLWEMAQWSSKYELCGTPPVFHADGTVEYSNKGKTVKVGKEPEAVLTLAINGGNEYPERARQANEPWVHLLVEQEFLMQPLISKLDSLMFRGEFRLTKSVLYKTTDYNSGIHAAQFLIYLQIRNVNKSSNGYGDFLWFGIPVYDDRYKIVPTYMNQDFAPAGNTGKFIYSASSSRFTKGVIRSGEWIGLERDLVPMIKDGLANAWKKGYLVASKDLGDYAVSYMNMGWELPGKFDVEMQIRKLSLVADY